MVDERIPRHARIGYGAKEFAAYWRWLNANAAGGHINPMNRVRAIDAAEKNLRGHGRHVKEDA